jgi:hypothetical protein
MTNLTVDPQFFHQVQKPQNHFIDPVASMPTRTGLGSLE